MDAGRICAALARCLAVRAAGCCRARGFAAAPSPSPCTARRRCPTTLPRCPTSIPTRRKAARMVEGVLGTFDSLNPLIVQGLAVQPIRGYVVESLMARGYDEPFTLYGLLARTVETDDARSYVTLRARSGGAFFRRHAGDRRRRGVLVAASARSRPAQSPHLLFQGRQGRNPRSAHRAFRFRRRAATANCR